jgi:hypothetical protein
VSTDIKSWTKYLKELRKHQLAHNIQNQMRDLYDWCETMGQCSTTDKKIQRICQQMYHNAKLAEQIVNPSEATLGQAW